jgi:hypothetical protein
MEQDRRNSRNLGHKLEPSMIPDHQTGRDTSIDPTLDTNVRNTDELVSEPSVFVMASVTNEIREERKQGRTEPGEAEPVRVELLTGRTDRLGSSSPDLPSHRTVTPMTSKEWDSGSPPMSQGDRATLTGKLCQWVMALIKWQCGVDKAVDDRMVRALEGWLWNRGISIYTDLS